MKGPKMKNQKVAPQQKVIDLVVNTTLVIFTAAIVLSTAGIAPSTPSAPVFHAITVE